MLLENPFGLIPYRTRDGRTVMASAVYPHQAAKWCRFLGVPPDFDKVAQAFTGWDAFELEEAANAAGLPACVARSPEEWLAHPHGALLASQPVTGSGASATHRRARWATPIDRWAACGCCRYPRGGRAHGGT